MLRLKVLSRPVGTFVSVVAQHLGTHPLKGALPQNHSLGTVASSTPDIAIPPARGSRVLGLVQLHAAPDREPLDRARQEDHEATDDPRDLCRPMRSSCLSSGCQAVLAHERVDGLLAFVVFSQGPHASPPACLKRADLAHAYPREQRQSRRAECVPSRAGLSTSSSPGAVAERRLAVQDIADPGAAHC
jgi:hypothetical protein